MLLVELEKRKKELEAIIKECTWELEKAPEGNLRVFTYKEKTRFYLYKPNDKGNGKYLSIKTQSDLIRQLAQKGYTQNALTDAQKELTAILEMIDLEDKQPVARVIGLTDERIRPFIKPIEITVEEKYRNWKKQGYTRQEERPGSFLWKTKRGEIVKSRAEMDIADALFAAGIDYKYEFPVMTDDKLNTAPDFMIFHPVTGEIIYWEHFGMMDRSQYVAKNISKINSYYLSEMFPGNGMIMTFSDNSNPLEKSTIQKIIRKLLS